MDNKEVIEEEYLLTVSLEVYKKLEMVAEKEQISINDFVSYLILDYFMDNSLRFNITKNK